MVPYRALADLSHRSPYRQFLAILLPQNHPEPEPEDDHETRRHCQPCQSGRGPFRFSQSNGSQLGAEIVRELAPHLELFSMRK
jgi:hypothetical protein